MCSQVLGIILLFIRLLFRIPSSCSHAVGMENGTTRKKKLWGNLRLRPKWSRGNKSSSKLQEWEEGQLDQRMSVSVPDVRYMRHMLPPFHQDLHQTLLQDPPCFSSPSSPVSQPLQQTGGSPLLSGNLLTVPNASSDWMSVNGSLLQRQDFFPGAPEEMDGRQPGQYTAVLPSLEVTEDSTEVGFK